MNPRWLWSMTALPFKCFSSRNPRPIISFEDRNKGGIKNICFFGFPYLWADHPHQITEQYYLWFSFCCLYISKSPSYCPLRYWSASTLTLVLWVISLQWWIASPYSSHVIWPCFQWPCAFFFCLSSRKWSLFSQDSLLPCLLDSWHFGITYSCAFKKWYLKTEQHGWTPRSWKACSQGISPTYSRAACSLLTSMFWVNVFLEVFLYYQRF